MKDSGQGLSFIVLLLLKDGSIIRYGKPLRFDVLQVFCRDLNRWLLGSRPLEFTGQQGDSLCLDAAQVASIDLMLAPDST